MNQHTDLGRLALSVGDVVTDQGQLAGPVVCHRVGNQEDQNEASGVRHLVIYTGKKFGWY